MDVVEMFTMILDIPFPHSTIFYIGLAYSAYTLASLQRLRLNYYFKKFLTLSLACITIGEVYSCEPADGNQVGLYDVNFIAI